MGSDRARGKQKVSPYEIELTNYRLYFLAAEVFVPTLSVWISLRAFSA